METINVRSKAGVTLVGAGAPSAQNVSESLTLAPDLVAADGGANFCAEMGHVPVAIIGDFDSLDPEVRADFSDADMIEVSEWAEQDSTDFQKCMARLQAPIVLAVGFTDARLDHTLANFGALAQMQGPPTILVGTQDIAFAAPAKISFDVPVGTRVSLFPMEPMSGTSQGLEWPIDGLTLAPLGRIGTSNRAVGPVQLMFDKPGCIVVLPRAMLRLVLPVLSD